MLPIDPETLNTITYFLQLSSPFLFLIGMLAILWTLEIFITQYIYGRVIFPEIRRNKIAYWLYGWLAIASHEVLGHMIVGLFTGARIDEVVITPTAGHVTSTQEVSLLGWLSLVLSSFAPCFSPPMLMLLFFYLLFPNTLILPNQYNSITDTTVQNIITILNTLTQLWNPYVLVFIYALIVTSSTAGASGEDVRVAVTRTIERPMVIIVAFFILLAIILALYTFGYDVVTFLFWLILLSFAIVMIGISIATLISIYLSYSRSLGLVAKMMSLIGYMVSYALFLYLAYSAAVALLLATTVGTITTILLRTLSNKMPKETVQQ